MDWVKRIIYILFAVTLFISTALAKENNGETTSENNKESDSSKPSAYTEKKGEEEKIEEKRKRGRRGRHRRRGKGKMKHYKIDDVVVTGTRTKSYIKEASIKTEVVTAREIETSNANNLFDVLKNVPGVRVQEQCQFCNFTEVKMQGLGTEYTQVLINGKPIYSALASVYGLQQIGTANIDRIEIVKGAGSALYGSNAVAGVINIITKEPSRTPSTRASAQFGSYNTNKYEISSSIKSGDVGLNVYAQKLTGDAIDETSEGMSVSEVENKDGISDRVSSNLISAGASIYLDNLLFKNDRIVASGRYLFEKRQGGILKDDYYKNPLTDGTENIVTDRYEAELTYRVNTSNKSVLSLSASYANHSRDATNDTFLNDYLEMHNDTAPDLRDMRPYLADENLLTTTLIYRHTLGDHFLMLGAQNYINELKESGTYLNIDEESQYYGQPYESESAKNAFELGFFIQDEWKVTDLFTVLGGLRYDIHNSEEKYIAEHESEEKYFPETKFDETSVNPRMGLKYKLTEDLTLRAKVGTGFRPPYGFSEDLHLCSGSPRVWKSTDLEPEKSISYNFSADYYGDFFRIGTNLFRTELKNKIAFYEADEDARAMGYDYQWENVDDAYVQGIEASLSVKLFHNLDIGMDFTYNAGEYNNPREDWIGTEYETASKKISRFPRTSGKFNVNYEHGGWVLTSSVNYNGRMYIDYRNEEIDPAVGDQSKIKETDPFFIVDLRAAKEFEKFKLFVGADNVLNYIQPEKHIDDAAFMYAPVFGAIYYAGISVKISGE